MIENLYSILRKCSICKINKNLISFEKSKNKPYDRGYRCNKCNALRAAIYRIKNPEKVKAYQKSENHKKSIRKSSKTYYHKNKKKRAISRKKWAIKNKKIIALHSRMRGKRVKQATPKWVNKKELYKIYQNCLPGYHIDHIIPITHPLICGLHVPWNLQYLPAIENIKKSNKLEV